MLWRVFLDSLEPSLLGKSIVPKCFELADLYFAYILIILLKCFTIFIAKGWPFLLLWQCFLRLQGNLSCMKYDHRYLSVSPLCNYHRNLVKSA